MILFFGHFLQFLTNSPAINHMHLAETFRVKQNNKELHTCKIFLPIRHKCGDMTHQIWKKMPKFDHFVIAPTLNYLVCALEWPQYEIDPII